MSELGKPLQTRHWVLGAGLAATLAATMWAAQTNPDDAAVQATAGDRRETSPLSEPGPSSHEAGKASNTNSEPEAPLVTDWSPVQRKPWAEARPGQFAAWSPPPPPAPPPPPPPAPPAPPMAPAFPYQLIGRMVDGNTPDAPAVAFLSGPLRSVAVHAGEVLEGQWRIDEISATGLAVTWLPGKLKQNIAFRPAS